MQFLPQVKKDDCICGVDKAGGMLYNNNCYITFDLRF